MSAEVVPFRGFTDRPAVPSTIPPPHNPEAERSVLGAVLLAPTCLRGLIVEEGLRPEHFYREQHRLIFAAMLAMSDAEQHVDVLTVAAHLAANGTLEQAGGKAALDELTGGVPMLGGVRRYAQIVIEEWRWHKRLISTYRQQAAAQHRSEPEFETALQQASELVALSTQESFLGPDRLADHFMAWLQEKPDEGLPLPPEFARHARMVRYRAGHVTVVSGWSQMGKALSVSTPIPTPAGWRTMGDLHDGDLVYGSDGARVRIMRAWPVMFERPCYRVTFRDGSEIVADEDHLWTVHTHASRRSEVAALAKVDRAGAGYDQTHKRARPVTITTAELRELVGPDKRGVSIPVAGAVQRPAVDLPVDPYVFGYWLGDGDSASAILSVGEQDLPHLVDQLERAGLRHRAWSTRPGNARVSLGGPDPVSGVRVMTCLRALGVRNDKHIPDLYLNASIEQRLALLQGLMDSDGTITPAGFSTFAVTSRRLAESVLDLTLSLGLRPKWSERAAKLNGREVSRCYEIDFTTQQPVFRLPRKLARLPKTMTAKTQHRYIASVEPVASVPVRCITVNASDHLYLAGRSHIPTHNSLYAIQCAAHIGREGHRSIIWTNEDNETEIVARYVNQQTGVPAVRIADRAISDRQLTTVYDTVIALPFEVQPAHGWTAQQIARHLVQERPALAVVDHFHALPSVGRTEDIDAAMQTLTAAAGRSRCHLFIVCQLNQSRSVGVVRPAPVGRDLRGSGQIFNLAHSVVFIHRQEEEQEDDNGRALGRAIQLEEGHIDVQKNKPAGHIGAVSVRFEADRLRFVETYL